MIQKVTADHVFINGSFHQNCIILADDDGMILRIDKSSDHDASTIKYHKGVLAPGFINTHCHLELSHMKGLVDTGTTLLPFLNSVVKYRDFPQEVILQAIDEADQYMYDHGIMAVGDISNKIDTAETKDRSKIDYYTFVEMFDFMSPAMTASTIANYEKVMLGQSDRNHNKKSFAPHAPYTVSPALFDFIAKQNSSECTVSIHNQETVHEDDLFLNGSGGFMDFYSGFGIDMSHFSPTGKTSIHYAIKHMNAANRNLFVHNTMTSAEDIAHAEKWSDSCYWATCPNANLYIENRLPNYQPFIHQNAKMTIGTDSLTSNWQLSIWEEIKTIHKFCSYVPMNLLLTWATANGAAALGYDDRLGSIEVNKAPGLIQLPLVFENNKWMITEDKIHRVI